MNSMNLQQTIDDLEQKAAEYTQAADSLRTLLPYENGDRTSQTTSGGVSGRTNASKANAKGGVKTSSASGMKQTGSKKAAGQKTTGKRTPVSPETRAKISASIKARHQQKKAENA
jgi:cell division septum initiation protein DivIVA